MSPRKIIRSIANVFRPRASYDAGKTGRRLGRWLPGNIGPNAAMWQDADTLRDRSRDSVRNNAWVKKGVTNWVSNEIGIGITPRSLSLDDGFRGAADALWKEWVKVADADGVHDFYGLLSMSCRTRIEGGEIFWRRRPRRADDGLVVPLQYQLLEPEFCPIQNDPVNNIRSGIRFSPIGARQSYRMYREHPGDFFTNFGADIVDVPASSIIHHYAPLRPGQLRGAPWTIQALIKAKDFDEYDDAELVRKKTRSAYTGAVTRQQYDDNDYKFDPISGAPIDRNDVPPVIDITAGTWVSLLPGEDVKPFDGDSTGQGYADFVRQALLGLAAGMDVPYEFLTGDYSKVNDRLVRVILNEYHRLLEQFQWLITIPQICNPVWKDFITTAIAAGALSAPGYAKDPSRYLAVEWRPYRWDYVHPLQDVQADAMRVDKGFASRSQVCSERGESAEDIDRQQSEDRARETELGISYDDASPADGGPADPAQAQVLDLGSDFIFGKTAREYQTRAVKVRDYRRAA